MRNVQRKKKKKDGEKEGERGERWVWEVGERVRDEGRRSGMRETKR